MLTYFLHMFYEFAKVVWVNWYFDWSLFPDLWKLRLICCDWCWGFHVFVCDFKLNVSNRSQFHGTAFIGILWLQRPVMWTILWQISLVGIKPPNQLDLTRSTSYSFESYIHVTANLSRSYHDHGKFQIL